MAIWTSLLKKRGVFALLLTLLLAVRGLVPVGYMLDRAPEDGSVIIRLCGGVHERLMLFNPETGDMRELDAEDGSAPVTPGDDAGSGASCPFALTSVFDLPEASGEILLGLFGPPLLANKPVYAPTSTRAEGPALPPRGPPVTV